MTLEELTQRALAAKKSKDTTARRVEVRAIFGALTHSLTHSLTH